MSKKKDIPDLAESPSISVVKLVIAIPRPTTLADLIVAAVNAACQLWDRTEGEFDE